MRFQARFAIYRMPRRMPVMLSCGIMGAPYREAESESKIQRDADRRSPEVAEKTIRDPNQEDRNQECRTERPRPRNAARDRLPPIPAEGYAAAVSATRPHRAPVPPPSATPPTPEPADTPRPPQGSPTPTPRQSSRDDRTEPEGAQTSCALSRPPRTRTTHPTLNWRNWRKATPPRPETPRTLRGSAPRSPAVRGNMTSAAG